MKKRIVAEVSRNWDGTEPPINSPLLCERFESVIKTNAESGFELESWNLTSAMTDEGHYFETIIAVFVKVDEHAAESAHAE